ncbi:hypothetical protein DVR12_19355 [Chitinophaga silvatica]|uniref:Peptidase S9 prolyl oligopeptidase catalytic domain-containing protein n=1 Tax=Chitinophaga silvatica TaxID=2282649 RepID=A0A3E1Y731_9BACT|nr:prolyl oligopeptidase family serine peptidase [Chitinophaga silvatica]RFS20717.1 hypothetical protein DVR12_19355 [Chitinophaga silvatica]
MNKFILLLLNIVLVSLPAYSQKKIIDTTAYANWSEIRYPSLTADGKYISYTLMNRDLNRRVLHLMSADGKWNKTIPDQYYGEMVADEKYCLIKSSDTLHLIKLGTDKTLSIKVSSYGMSDDQARNVLYFQSSGNNDLFIRNITSEENREIKDLGVVDSYYFFPKVKSLLVKVKDSLQFDLKLIDLTTLKVREISKSQDLRVITPDTINSQFTFTIGDHTTDLWHYNIAENKSTHLFRSTTELIYPMRFSEDGNRLFFLQSKLDSTRSESLADLNIWSYRDAPGMYDPIMSFGNDLYSVFSFKDKSIVHLQHGKSRIDLLSGNGDRYAIEIRDSLLDGSRFTPKSSLISSVDGRVMKEFGPYVFSAPDGKFLVYVNGKDYFAYEIATGTTTNLTAHLNNTWIKTEDGDYDFANLTAGVVAWGKDDHSVYIADEFDLWKFDLTGETSAKCLTAEYGRKNKIAFTIIGVNQTKPMFNQLIIDADKKIVLVAFNKVTKQNGFYYIKNSKATGDPVKLIMKDGTYWISSLALSFPGLTSNSFKPVKAANSDLYLLEYSTATEFPNLFLTKDFNKFTQLTNLHPEKEYNWFTTELVNWQVPGGRMLQGVLYKPENFDSTRQYPIIFYHYRKASANLNAYMIPRQYPGCVIDIPTYVSNGYLVFTPDIYFTKGETGKSALDALTSAADELVKRPYIDERRLGVQGCSFSGFTTNYIVTHTGRFAAAASASGLADFVSGYNSINGGAIKQEQFEDGGPYQMGSKLWENPQAYIRNSPVFNVPDLTTPLLLMHTTKDFTVPFSNAMEFYLAAKRLGKKVWLLEYGNNSSHIVTGKEGDDFNIRMMQFFNYYLRNENPPRWLTEGRLPKNKNTDAAFDLDNSGRIP